MSITSEAPGDSDSETAKVMAVKSFDEFLLFY
jgi:hypothetical protein